MDLNSLIDHPSKLPTVPRVTQRIIASFGAEDVTVGEIAQLIEADSVLSAKLLRLANSSYFQVSRPIESVEDAIRILGMAMVRNIVLAGGLTGIYPNLRGIDMHQFWTHSLYTACTARWLAEHSAVNRDQVFTIGLMHTIGQLHLHSAAPAVAVALDRQSHVLSDERVGHEIAALGFSYLNVSSALASLWNFPSSLVEPLKYIADPLGAPQFSAAAAMVCLSAWHARNAIFEVPAEEIHSRYPQAIGNSLGISSTWVIQKANSTAQDAMPCIPKLHELTHGLDEILT